MINMFNNHTSYRVKYKLLHDTTKIDSNSIYDILKKRKFNLWEFSYKIKRFSNNNPTFLFKGLPYILKGFNIKETELILKKPSLSRNGFNYLNDTIKNKNSNSFLFTRNNLKVNIISNRKFSTKIINNEIKNNSKFNNNSKLILTRFKGSELENSKQNINIENRINSTIFSKLKVKTLRQPANLIKKNKINLSKKRIFLKKLSNYKLSVLDLTWLNKLIEIRKTINSKYKFNLFLSNSKIVEYSFSNKYKLTDLNNLYKILKYFFYSLSALISKPEYFILPNKIYIRLFYYLMPIHSILKKERKLKYLLRKDFSYNQKDKNVFFKLLIKFKMKSFLAKWKENNKLLQLPLLPDALSNLIETINLNYHFYDERSKINLLNKDETNQKELIYNYLLKNSFCYNKEDSIKNNQILYNLYNSNLTSVNLLQFRANQISHFILNPEIKFGLNLFNLNNNNSSIQQNRDVLNEKLENINFDSKILTNLDSLSSNKLLIKLIDKDTFKNGFNSLQLLKFRKFKTMLSLNDRISQFLLFNLEQYFKKEVVLDIKRIKYPYHNSNILSQILKNSSYRLTFRNMMKKLLNIAVIKNPVKLKLVNKQDFSIVPSYLSGIKIKLAGRLVTQRLIPRFTAQSFQMGSLARGKVTFLDTSRITHKNKRGAFSFTVTTSHYIDNN